jgi:hypothetical protein
MQKKLLEEKEKELRLQQMESERSIEMFKQQLAEQ